MSHEWSRKERRVGYWWEIQKDRDHWEDQDVDGWTILKLFLRETGCRGMDWIDLPQDMDE
jgi:hypothetical protein